MKQLYEIASLYDIEQQRTRLLRKLHKQEKQVNKDLQTINRKWQRLELIGSWASNLAVTLAPKISVFSFGLKLAKRLFRRKK